MPGGNWYEQVVDHVPLGLHRAVQFFHGCKYSEGSQVETDILKEQREAQSGDTDRIPLDWL